MPVPFGTGIFSLSGVGTVINGALDPLSACFGVNLYAALGYFRNTRYGAFLGVIRVGCDLQHLRVFAAPDHIHSLPLRQDDQVQRYLFV